MKRPTLVLVFPLVLTAALFVLLGLALVLGWFGPAGAANRYFCEYAGAGPIREPANTVSNLGFLVAGLASAWTIWSGQFRRNENPFTRNEAIAVLFPALVILLGFGSMAMHASETDLGGEFDLLAMYLVAGFTSAYAMRRYFGWSWSAFVLAFVLSVLCCEIAGQYREPVVPVLDYAGDAAFAILAVLTVLFETLNTFRRAAPRDNEWGAAALASLLAAFAAWNFGRNDCPFCRPDSWWQAHALWHLLLALALYCLFRLHVSETAARA
jgi:hypothetical protein